MRQICELDEAGQVLIKAAIMQLQLSVRAYHRILKSAHTITDLTWGHIQSAHLADELQYRRDGLKGKKMGKEMLGDRRQVENMHGAKIYQNNMALNRKELLV